MVFCREGHCWMCCVHSFYILILGEKVIIFILIYCCTCLLYVIKVILGLCSQQRCDFMSVSQAEGAETPFPGREPRGRGDGVERVSCRPRGRSSALTPCSSSCQKGLGGSGKGGGGNCCAFPRACVTECFRSLC